MSARSLAATATFLLLLGTAASASAYCVSRTCNPDDPDQNCETDAEGCIVTGEPLHWVSSCVTFDVQVNGSPKSALDATEVTEVASRAFSAWMRADCAGAPPSIIVGTFGPVACAESRYNETARNANVVLFHDDEWPYPGASDTFGFTKVRFNTQTGEILDADVELNSADFDITVDGSDDGADLESILTHEFGHFLGLTHTGPEHSDATMRAGWNGSGTALRTLSADDDAAICASYPPERNAPSTCEPRNGFSGECFTPLAAAADGSCASAPRSADRGSTGSAAALLLALALWRRRAERRSLSD